MRRRTLAALALLAMAALAGCADPAGSLRMVPVDDAEMADRASHEASAGDRPADLAREIRTRERVRRAIENGTLNVTAARPPIDDELPYEYRGAYYDLSSERVGTRPAVETEVEIDHNATDPGGPRVAFTELSAADRERIEPAITRESRTDRPGPEVEAHLTYPDPAAASSTLLAHAGGSVVVVHGGEEYALTIGETSEATLGVYRYEATLAAANATAYAEQLRDGYAFTLSGLSEAEASVVEEAAGGSYYAGSTDDEGFAALVERFRDREGVRRSEYGGEFIVRYGDRVYWAEMEYGAFVDEG